MTDHAPPRPHVVITLTREPRLRYLTNTLATLYAPQHIQTAMTIAQFGERPVPTPADCVRFFSAMRN